MSISNHQSVTRTALGILAAFGLLLSTLLMVTPVFADGADSSAECTAMTTNVDAEHPGQSEDEVTVDAGAGNIVTAICIKSGSEAFGDEKHSGVIDADGTYDDCYTVEGIGTQTVTVTKADSSECKGISHVDAAVAGAPSQSASASPSESESASESESESASPSESVNEGELGGNPTSTPGGGTLPDTALGSSNVPAWPFALLFLMSLSGLLVLRLTAEEHRSR